MKIKLICMKIKLTCKRSACSNERSGMETKAKVNSAENGLPYHQMKTILCYLNTVKFKLLGGVGVGVGVGVGLKLPWRKQIT